MHPNVFLINGEQIYTEVWNVNVNAYEEVNDRVSLKNHKISLPYMFYSLIK